MHHAYQCFVVCEQTLTLKEYEEKLKTKSLTNVVQRPEVDMGQFEGLTVFKKIDEGTGLETLEQARPKRTRSKGKKEGKREVLWQMGQSLFAHAATPSCRVLVQLHPVCLCL